MKYSDFELKKMAKELEIPRCVTINQASKMCGLPYTKIKKMIDNGELSVIMAESRHYIDVDELKSALKTLKQRKRVTN